MLVTLELAADPILELLETVLLEHLDEIIDGDDATIVIPYQIQGGIWFVVENFGRFGVNFGPVTGTWKL